MAHRANKVYVEDAGTVVLLNTGTDLTEATVTNIKVKKPDGSEHTWVGTIHETKYVKYITQQLSAGGINVVDMAITASSDDSGLLANTVYSYLLNDLEFLFDTTGMTEPISFVDVVNQLNTDLASEDIEVTIASQDLVFTSTITQAESVVVLDNGIENDFFISLNTYISILDAVEPDLGDWNLHGEYYLQAYVEIEDWKGRGETAKIDVYKRFK